MSSPLVSILIPAYNSSLWIKDTLYSALHQTHPYCEIIVVNDGSTDDTLEQIETVASRHPGRIQVASQKNSGSCTARNHAARLANGDFLQHLDADDLLAPDKIENQLKAIEGLSPLTLSMGMWGKFTQDPKKTMWAENEDVYRAKNGIEFLQLAFETHTMVQPGGWLIPRQLAELSGPWEEGFSLSEDTPYFARTTLLADRLLHAPSARVHYRTNVSSSLSRLRNPQAMLSLNRAVTLAIQRLLAADSSPRSRAAAILAWRRLAGELYPYANDLARAARRAARELGASDDTPIGVPSWVSAAALLVGWPNARRLQNLRNRLA